MVKSFVLVAVFVLCASVWMPAQTAAEINKIQYEGIFSPDATSTCSYTFTSGSGNTYVKYCVTKNGNITQFQSPSGQQYVSKAPAGEGYGFCNFNNQTQYYDYAGYGDSGNWGTSTKVSSSTTSVKISRKTSDGKYTLVQTITLIPSSSRAQVTMTLTNNSSTAAHIGLLRFADADVSNQATNTFDFTRRSAFAYNESGYGFGLYHVSGSVLNGGITQGIPGKPNACQPFLNEAAPFTGDGSLLMQYDIQLAAHASTTVVTQYGAF